MDGNTHTLKITSHGSGSGWHGPKRKTTLHFWGVLLPATVNPPKKLLLCIREKPATENHHRPLLLSFCQGVNLGELNGTPIFQTPVLNHRPPAHRPGGWSDVQNHCPSHQVAIHICWCGVEVRMGRWTMALGSHWWIEAEQEEAVEPCVFLPSSSSEEFQCLHQVGHKGKNIVVYYIHKGCVVFSMPETFSILTVFLAMPRGVWTEDTSRSTRPKPSLFKMKICSLDSSQGRWKSLRLPPKPTLPSMDSILQSPD